MKSLVKVSLLAAMMAVWSFFPFAAMADVFALSIADETELQLRHGIDRALRLVVLVEDRHADTHQEVVLADAEAHSRLELELEGVVDAATQQAAVRAHRLCGDPPVVSCASGGMAAGRTGGDRYGAQYLRGGRHYAGSLFGHQIRTQGPEAQRYPGSNEDPS